MEQAKNLDLVSVVPVLYENNWTNPKKDRGNEFEDSDQLQITLFS